MTSVSGTKLLPSPPSDRHGTRTRRRPMEAGAHAVAMGRKMTVPDAEVVASTYTRLTAMRMSEVMPACSRK